MIFFIVQVCFVQLLGAQPFGNRVVEGSAVKRPVDFHSLVMVRSRPVLDVLGPEEGNSCQFYTALQHIHKSCTELQPGALAYDAYVGS